MAYIYNDLTLEDCFILYHTHNTACVCDADSKEVLTED